MPDTLEVPGTSWVVHKKLIELLKSHNIYDKKAITIVVTDSGLGGIAVAAELYRILKENTQYEKANIIFFNALFDENSGYTRLDSLDQKVHMFNSALKGMLHYSPDLILIASNTLSLLYPYTSFSKSAMFPVIGIIEIGINYIIRRAASNKKSTVIIFATPTAIHEGTHKKLLTQYLPDTEIIEQACPELAFVIGDGKEEKTKQLIEEYTTQAIQKLHSKDTQIYASLSCTHFGYYQDAFLRVFQRNGLGNVEILNPNSEMAKLLLPEKEYKAIPHSELTIEFVSKVKINPKGIDSLLPFLEPLSEEVVAAFRNYHYNPDLF